MATAVIEGAPSHKNIAEALSKLQANLPTVTLDGDNPHFKSKFMTLGNLSSVLLPKLAEQGLSYTTTSRVEDGKLILEANLLHKSGESLTAEFLITETMPQKVGSAVTYYRRYGLAALTGVVADQDDDGNAASAAPPKALQQAEERKANPPRKASGSQAKIRSEFLDVENPVVTREQVNALTTRIKNEEGKRGEELYAAVYAALKNGEVE